MIFLSVATLKFPTVDFEPKSVIFFSFKVPTQYGVMTFHMVVVMCVSG